MATICAVWPEVRSDAQQDYANGRALLLSPPVFPATPLLPPQPVVVLLAQLEDLLLHQEWAQGGHRAAQGEQMWAFAQRARSGRAPSFQWLEE